MNYSGASVIYQVWESDEIEQINESEFEAMMKAYQVFDYRVLIFVCHGLKECREKSFRSDDCQYGSGCDYALAEKQIFGLLKDEKLLLLSGESGTTALRSMYKYINPYDFFEIVDSLGWKLPPFIKRLADQASAISSASLKKNHRKDRSGGIEQIKSLCLVDKVKLFIRIKGLIAWELDESLSRADILNDPEIKKYLKKAQITGEDTASDWLKEVDHRN